MERHNMTMLKFCDKTVGASVGIIVTEAANDLQALIQRLEGHSTLPELQEAWDMLDSVSAVLHDWYNSYYVEDI